MHLDGRPVFLGLKLDGRCLVLNVLFKLLRRDSLAAGHHADDGQGPGAFLDALGQAAGKVDALQNVHARRHMHRDAVRFDTDGRLVQKAVDRQALAFQLLNKGAGRLRRDVAVIEIISEGQFIALEHRFQRRKKPPAHGAVQRLRAAQADDDLAGGAVQFDSIDQHLPETGVELSIGRKLRPNLCDKGFQGISFFCEGGSVFRGFSIPVICQTAVFLPRLS